MSAYPFDHIVTKLRTTKGSPFALNVMAEAANRIEELEAALSAQHQDHTELIAEARTWDWTIARAAPTTTAVLVQKLADALEGKINE